jgi:serine beta-lactamase-like protein LACTB
MKKRLNFNRYLLKSLVFLFFPCVCFSQQDLIVAVAKTDDMAAKFIDKHNIPGIAISISYNDTIIYSKGFGYANIEAKLPVIPSQSQFRIGSITKSLTAMALAKLQQQGKINFDESIYHYLDSLPKKEYDFTIRQVGGHLAGLERMYLTYNTDSLHTVSRQELYKSFKGRLLYKPGTKHLYSNFGFELLGMVVENVQHSSFDDAIKVLVLNPLKMTNTGAKPNVRSNTEYYTKIKGGEKVTALYMGYTVNTASGYLYATSEDLVRMGNALLIPDRLLDKKNLLELIKPQKLASGKSVGYGFGIESVITDKGHWSYGHSGHIYGGTSFYGVSPEHKFVIAVLVNCDYLKPGSINEFTQKISSEYFKALKH